MKTNFSAFKALALGASLLMLSACETMPQFNDPFNSGGQASSNRVIETGPLAGMTIGDVQSGNDGSSAQKPAAKVVYLDVAISEFDPGIPLAADGSIDYVKAKEQNIFYQLRRTEAKKFAVKTRDALLAKSTFGAVRVTPTGAVPSEIYINGKILKSDGEDVSIEVKVAAANGALLGTKTFDYEVPEGFLQDGRNNGQNTYQPLFDKVAVYVEGLISKLNTTEREALQKLNQVAYGAKYSPKSFGAHLAMGNDGEVKLVSLPAQGDAMFARTEKIRASDNLFMDKMQTYYSDFDTSTEDTYQNWQRTVLGQIKERDEASRKKGLAILGTLAGITCAVIANKSNTGTGDAVRNACVGGAVIGAAATYSASQAQAEQEKIIAEMSTAVDRDMSPIEMDFEGKKTQLQGTASEQYTQWRGQLKKIYDIESGSKANM